MICRAQPHCLAEGNPSPRVPFIGGRSSLSHPISYSKIFPFPSSFIYSTDPDASHVKVKCSRRCVVGFHPACYTIMKKKSKVECSTPDCDGVVVNVDQH